MSQGLDLDLSDSEACTFLASFGIEQRLLRQKFIESAEEHLGGDSAKACSAFSV